MSPECQTAVKRGAHSTQKRRQHSPSPLEVEDIETQGEISPLAEDIIANTVDMADSVASLEVAPSVVDLTMHSTSDVAIEDEINVLADKLAAFCFEHLEEDLQVGYGVDVVDTSMDQDAFDKELQVRDPNTIRH